MARTLSLIVHNLVFTMVVPGLGGECAGVISVTGEAGSR
jgi:hypothetical protein